MWPLYHEVSFHLHFNHWDSFNQNITKHKLLFVKNLHGTLSENYIHAPFFLFIKSVPTEPFCPRPLCYMGTLSLTNIT